MLETALPVKFAETIVEAIGRQPERPSRFAGIEDLPRHLVELPNDAEALKELISSVVNSSGWSSAVAGSADRGRDPGGRAGMTS